MRKEGEMRKRNDDEEHAYKMGKDCALNGANTTNCHFTIFSTWQKTIAWEQGQSAGEASKNDEQEYWHDKDPRHDGETI